MTHPGTPRDIDLDGWLTGIGFHPADTREKQLGHDAARRVTAQFGKLLHALLPPGRAKSLVFTQLEDLLMRANYALANDGPRLSEPELREMIQSWGIIAMPTDPRVDLAAYESQQLADRQPVQLEGEPGDQRTALEDRVYALLRSTLGESYEITGLSYRVAAEAIVRALTAPAEAPSPEGLTAPAGYVSPFKQLGHEGPHHGLRFRPPLQQPFTQFKYSTGEEPGSVRSISVRYPGFTAPSVGIQVERHIGVDHDRAGIDVTDPDVLDEIAAGIKAAADRLRTEQAKR